MHAARFARWKRNRVDQSGLEPEACGLAFSTMPRWRSAIDLLALVQKNDLVSADLSVRCSRISAPCPPSRRTSSRTCASTSSRLCRRSSRTSCPCRPSWTCCRKSTSFVPHHLALAHFIHGFHLGLAQHQHVVHAHSAYDVPYEHPSLVRAVHDFAPYLYYSAHARPSQDLQNFSRISIRQSNHFPSPTAATSLLLLCQLR